MVSRLGPANHRDRVAATGVDLLLVALIGSLVLTFTGEARWTLRLGVLLLGVGLPTFVLEGTVGRTLGKFGTQLVHAPADAPGPPLRLAQAAGRFLLKWVVPVVLVVLGLWLAAIAWWVALYLPAFGPDARAAHDRLTRTTVLGPATRERAEGT